jgi:hypothetical protein
MNEREKGPDPGEKHRRQRAFGTGPVALTARTVTVHGPGQSPLRLGWPGPYPAPPNAQGLSEACIERWLWNGDDKKDRGNWWHIG